MKNKKQYRTDINDGEAHSKFERWVADSGQREKATFLSNEEGMDELFSNIGPDFKSPQKKWLVSLWSLFHDAHVNKRRWDPAANATYDHATRDGRLTFETLLAAMGSIPQ